jgi:DNA primase
MTILQDLIQEDYGLSGRGKWFHSNDHDSLVYNAEGDYFFWNSQNLKGNALDYLIKVRGLEKSEASKFLNNYFGAFKENSETAPKSVPYDRLVDVMWANGLSNREYWYKRCLKDETIDRYKLGYYEGWNLIPIYEDMEFVNFQMRRDIPEKKITQWYSRGKALPLFNEGILPYTDKVFITESATDAILLNQEGLPCISPNGSGTWQQSWFSKFNKIKEIVYFADNDKAGLKGAELVANSLGIYRVKIVLFEGKEDKFDTGNFFQEGGTKESLLDWIKGHSYYLFEIKNIYGKTKDIGKYRKEFQWAR